jgi:O-antigen/teichoic acid export membrane protein
MIILGEKWSGIIEPMKILALCGLLIALAGLNSSILQAVRRPDVITKLTLIKLAVIMTLIYPMTMERGLNGSAFVVLLSSILITPNAYYIVTRRILGCPAVSLLKCIALPLIGTIVASVTTGALLRLDTSLFILTASVTIGVTTYVGITMLLERATGLRAWRNITEVMRVLSS